MTCHKTYKTPRCYVDPRPHGGPRIVAKRGQQVIAAMYKTRCDMRIEIDAHMMAAARQMLDALEAAEGHLNKYAATHPRGRCKVLGTVRAAIAAAKGEYNG